MLLAYYSAKSGNTRRFVKRTGLPCVFIGEGEYIEVNEPYVLVTPTYNGRVPDPVVQFLNKPTNRMNLQGVINSGNTNFGEEFGAAGRKISAKCNVPLLHVFELTGHPEDVKIVYDKVTNLWNNHTLTSTASK